MAASLTSEIHAHVLTLLKRHGWNATSFQILEPDFQYWFDGDDACVAYVETGRAWVVAGGPIAPLDAIGTVAERFTRHAAERGRRVSFFAVEERFLRALPYEAIQIGEQPFWNPGRWIDHLREHRSLREQLRRARAKGVRIERVSAATIEDAGSPVRVAIEELIQRWISSRRMPAMAFLVELVPFAYPRERRYYVAWRGGRLCGLLVAVPVYRRNGWFFEDLLRDPEAPNGTAEALVDAAFRDLSGESSFVTMGLAPLAGSASWMKVARRLMGGFYNFEGVLAFKAKLRPEGWDPIFLAYPRSRSAAAALFDGLAAFAHGRPFRFGLAALFRAPSQIVRLMALMLLPWTVVLALPHPTRWFPTAEMQLAWVSFDLLLAAGLFSLARKWRFLLGVLLATALTFDVALTAVQAVIFNIPRASRPLEWMVIAISLGAPAVAGAVLWGGVRSRISLDRPLGIRSGSWGARDRRRSDRDA